jgi:hypothetical protein
VMPSGALSWSVRMNPWLMVCSCLVVVFPL